MTDLDPTSTVLNRGEVALSKTADTLELLKLARAGSGRSLDFWADLTEGLSRDALEIIVSRAHMIAI